MSTVEALAAELSAMRAITKSLKNNTEKLDAAGKKRVIEYVMSLARDALTVMAK